MATGSVSPFLALASATIAASTSPAGATLPARGDSILVFNSSAATAFVAIGGAATAASTPVPAGARQLFAGGAYASAVSVVLASGTGNVVFTAGQGTAY